MIAAHLATLLTLAAPSPDGASAPRLTPTQAAQSVANGDDVAAATAVLVASGRRGLWALDALARTTRGDAKARVIAAMGHFDDADASWALIVAYRSSDEYARAGAVRGMALAPNLERERLIHRAAPEGSEVVRDAVVDALVAVAAARGGLVQDARLAALLGHASPYAREVALRVIERAGDPALMNAVVGRALADASPIVQVRAIDLASTCRAVSQAPALARLAVAKDPIVAAHARRAIAAFDVPEAKRVAGAKRYTDPTPPIPGAQM